MSLNHKFALIQNETCVPRDYIRWIRRERKPLSTASVEAPILLHDDLVRYVSDTLAWIPMLNPGGGRLQKGLNFKGVTAILPSGARIAAQVMDGWADLFDLGPKKLLLTGQYTWTHGRRSGGRYERLAFSKRTSVEGFRSISRMCAKVAAGHSMWLLHEGI